MKLSNKGRYAIRALFDIAFFNDGQPTQVKDIAERQEIPARFLEQIFQDLKRAGLVGSKRGPQGGYSLLMPPSAIRLGDVFEVTDGPFSFGDSSDLERHETSNGVVPSCRRLTESVFAELGVQVKSCFDSVSIETLCEQADAAGLRKSPQQRYTYTI